MSTVVDIPTIPSKWDIIPIHTSDIASYKRCRRYWDWTSPTRTNLRKKVEIHGINFPLWFGSGIHYALEMYYNPMLKRDPEEAFRTWFTLQWEGGIVTEDWLERTYDLNPQELISGAKGETKFEIVEPSTWMIRGLRDLHPDPDHDEFETHRELGIGMMAFYRDYAPKHDDFEVIAAESSYSIPLGFESVDKREQSPNYGQMLEVHARGKRDAVIQNLETGKYGIIDHKSAIQIGENYFLKLEKDEQVSNYVWASQEEARINDLPWTRIDHAIYNALRKAYPKRPTPLSNGTPSLSRTNESTTPELFTAYIVENDLQDWFKGHGKAQLYYEYLVASGNEQFIQRDIVRRNPNETNATGEHVRMVAEEMLSDPSIYPHPTGDFLCIRCALRAPCIAKDEGSDWEYMLDNGYEKNLDR